LSAKHVLQLFDTIESRATSLSAFVNRGLADGEDVVLVATSEHWKAVEERLNSTECRVGSAIAERRLTVVDARDSLDAIMKQGLPDRLLFSECVARAFPENRGPQRRPVRVYGELVDLLAEEGNFSAAIALEKLWNDLLNSWSFMLLCGYSSAHFCGPRVGSALRDVCGCHSLIENDEDNSLASFLIRESERRRSAVRVFVCSGECRMVDTADAARLNSHFFEITQKDRDGVIRTLLTLRAADVLGAEILRDGKVVDYVVGGHSRVDDESTTR
jgi:MEDS: MEthanogen/methylotroph, DcmR Sensory domain